MTDLFKALLSDIANDCVNGQSGPMNWSATERARETSAKQFSRIMPEGEDEPEERRNFDAYENRLYRETPTDGHMYGDTLPLPGWPIWSMRGAEQWAVEYGEEYEPDQLADDYAAWDEDDE